MAAFSSLRLSTSAYNKHKKSEGGSGSNAYLLESGSGVLNITGYDDEATSVIDQSVDDGEDSLEIPFNISDSVVCPATLPYGLLVNNDAGLGLDADSRRAPYPDATLGALNTNSSIFILRECL